MFSLKKNKFFYEIIEYNQESKYNQDFINDNRCYENESALRARRTCIDYGLNNVWNYFITITFDDSKVNIQDKESILRSLLQYFNNYQKRIDNDFRYLIIPEIGEDNGRLHFHGLAYLSNLSHLSYLYFDKKTFNRVYRNDKLYKRFGANQFIKINKLTEAVVYYISKYITKSDNRIFSRFYYCSKGLKKSVKVPMNQLKVASYIDKLRYFNIKPAFANEFLVKYRIPCGEFEKYYLSGALDYIDRPDLKAKFDILRKLEKNKK